MNFQFRNVSALLIRKDGLLIRRFYGDSFKTYQFCHGQEPPCCNPGDVDGRRLSRPSQNYGSVNHDAAQLKRNSSPMIIASPIAAFMMNNKLFRYKSNLRRMFSTDSGLPPHQELGMPSLSPTMAEGNIVRWLKKEGDKVSPGEVLCEIETDKATVDMECMEDGYLAKIVHGDGAKEIKVGDVIAVTVEEEEDIARFKDYGPETSSESKSLNSSASPPPTQDPPSKPLTTPEPKAVKPAPTPSSDHGNILCSPLARKLAEDNKVPISEIKGSGPDGLIVKADVDEYLATSGKDARPAPSKETAAVGSEYTETALSDIRKAAASALLLSKQRIPHYYLTVDTCIDELVGLRNELNALQASPSLKQVSIDDLIIKAAALALRHVPECNSSWTDDYIRRYKDVNINVAFHTPKGIHTPVLRGVDKKGLSEIAQELHSFSEKADSDSFNPEDYEDGTFTVSNLGGSFRVKQFCDIIRPAQSGILAVGSAEKRVMPGVAPSEFKIASFITATLSCDHRVIDGAVGAEWLKAFKGYVENPVSMLL